MNKLQLFKNRAWKRERNKNDAFLEDINVVIEKTNEIVELLNNTGLPDGDLSVDTLTYNTLNPPISVPPAYVGRTIYVDTTYGNDSTGVPYRSDKPYKTYYAAYSVAQAGDTIVLRAGNYNETFYLKNGVNVHCENGVLLMNRIYDNYQTVAMKWTGYADITHTAYQAIEIRSSNSNVSLTFKNVTIAKRFVHCIQSTGNNVEVYCDNLYCGNDGAWEVKYNANVKIVVRNLYTCGKSGLIRDGFIGKLHLEFGRVSIIRTSSQGYTLDGGFLSDNTTGAVPVPSARIYVKVHQGVHYSWDTTYPVVWFLYAMGNCRWDIEADVFASAGPVGLLSGAWGDVSLGGYVRYTGKFYTRDWMIVNMCVGAKVILDNAELIRGVGTTGSVGGHDFQGTEVIIFGGTTGWNSEWHGRGDALQLEIRDSVIKKDSDSVTPPTYHAGIVQVGGPNSKTYIKNSEIIGINCPANTYALKAADVANGNVYLKNTVTNLTALNIVDTSVGGAGLTQSDVNLDTQFMM